jgi:hypothetical protein
VKGKAKAPARKDISEDFPPRGFVLCYDCGQPMTSCWSKGRPKHYPYCLCDTRGWTISENLFRAIRSKTALQTI